MTTLHGQASSLLRSFDDLADADLQDADQLIRIERARSGANDGVAGRERFLIHERRLAEALGVLAGEQRALAEEFLGARISFPDRQDRQVVVHLNLRRKRQT